MKSISPKIVPAAPAETQEALAPLTPDLDRWSPGEEGGGLTLSYYWLLIRRYRWRIITFVLLTTVAVALLTLALPKEYESIAILRVDPSGVRVVGEEDRQVGDRQSEMLVDTEQKVLTSPAVVWQAMETSSLTGRDPQLAKLAADTALLPDQRREALLREVGKRIDVTRPLGTLLLEVHFRSRDTRVAADFANALVESLIQHEYSSRSRALTDSSRYMGAQVDQVKAAMERDQKALVDYESSADVLDPDDKTNIMTARLSQINEDMTKAQSVRMKLQADYEIVRSGDLDALLVSDRGQTLVPLRARLVDDERQAARLATVYGPRHPLLLQQQQIVDHDRSVLRNEQLHIATQVSDEYRAALGRENLLRGALEEQRVAVDKFNLKAIRYHALKAASDSSTRLFFDLQQRIQDANVAANLRSEDLRIVSGAHPTDKPVFPRILLSTVLAFLLSSVLGTGAAVMAGALDKSVSGPEQVEHWFGLPVISCLPQVGAKDAATALSPISYSPRMLTDGAEAAARSETGLLRQRSPFREAVLSMHTSLLLSAGDRARVVAISSALPGEGKSTAASNLASAFAGLGGPTVLIDADMRRPNVHRLFHLPNRVGLSNLLRGQVTLNEALVESGVKNLVLLPSGPISSTPSELLHLGLGDVIEQLRGRFEYVLIDCPPVLGFSDSFAVAGVADTVVLVVHAGETERQHVAAAVRQLHGVRANVLGVVLNRVSEALDSAYSYYGAYYTKYYGHGTES